MGLNKIGYLLVFTLLFFLVARTDAFIGECQLQCPFDHVCCQPSASLLPKCIPKCYFKTCPKDTVCNVHPETGEACCVNVNPTSSSLSSTFATTTVSTQSTVASTVASTIASTGSSSTTVSTVATTTVSTASLTASTVATTTASTSASSSSTSVSTVATTTVSTQSTTASTIASTVAQVTSTLPISSTVATTTVSTQSTTASTIVTSGEIPVVSTSASTSASTQSTVATTTVSTTSSGAVTTTATTTVSTASTVASTSASTTSPTSSAPVTTTVSTTVSTQSTIASTSASTTLVPPITTGASTSASTQSTVATTTVSTVASGPITTTASTTVSTASTVATTTVSTTSIPVTTTVSTTVTTTASTTVTTTASQTTSPVTTTVTTTVSTTASTASTVATTTVSPVTTTASTTVTTTATPTSSTTATTTVSTTSAPTTTASTTVSTASTTVSTTSSPTTSEPVTTTVSTGATTMTTIASTTVSTTSPTTSVPVTTTVTTTASTTASTIVSTTSSPTTSEPVTTTASTTVSTASTTASTTVSTTAPSTTASTTVSTTSIPTTTTTATTTASTTAPPTTTASTTVSTTSIPTTTTTATTTASTTSPVTTTSSTTSAPVQKYRIIGYSWIDSNDDGVSNAGEPWLGGMKGALHKCTPSKNVRPLRRKVTCTKLGDFTTDASKRYSGFNFEDLDEGQYCIEMNDPKGTYAHSKMGPDNTYNSTGWSCFKLDALTTNSNKTISVPAGYKPIGPEPVYTIRGYSWIDSNKDGVSNTGEPWLGDMVGQLTTVDGKVIGNFTTDASKRYDGFRFDNLKQGGYCVTIKDPKKAYENGPMGTDNKVDPATQKYCFSVDSSTVDSSNIFNVPMGFVPLPPVPRYTLHGYSWIDTSKDGISNVGEPWLGGMSGILTDDKGNEISTFTTDASKRYDGYRIEGLAAGKYCLKIFDPKGEYKNTPSGIDSKFNTTSQHCFTLDDTTVDSKKELSLPAGFEPVGPEPLYTIRGYSWNDSNKNGVSEVGEPWLGGMTGTLTTSDGTLIGPITTDAAKKYDGFRFDNLKQGGYCVKISDPTKAYQNGPMGTDNKVNPLTQKYCFSLDSSTADSNKIFNVPAGFIPTVPGPKYTIRGYSWIDTSKDGVSSAGEPWLGGMSGVLMDDKGNELTTFTTDAAKRYDGFRIENLEPGKYCLKISDPKGQYKTGPIGTDNKFNSSSINCFTLDATTVNSKNELNIAAGFEPIGPEPKYTIRGYSWNDSNKNGKSETGEPWLGGMTGTLTDIDDKEIGTFTTDAAKKYDGFRFDNLKQGGYCIKISDPTKAYQNGPMGTDNKVDPSAQKYCFSVDSSTVDSSNIFNVPMGFVPTPTTPQYTLRGYSWIDTSKDGVSNAGEPWLGGMKGELTDSTGKVINTFTTDASKRYDGFRIEKLNPGKYCLKITDPTGGYKTGPMGTDNKFNESSINCFTLDATTVNSKGELDIAAGFVPAGTEPVYTIRGYSWIDSNKNGKSEAGEPWLGDMTGTLTDIDGKEIGTFTTDAAKKYDGFRFDNMKQGGYCIKISDPKKAYDNGPMGDDNKINPSTQKYCFSVDATTVDSSMIFNIPAGFIPTVPGPKYTIRGYSWVDSNKDGVSNTGEPWLGGMSGVLMDENGNTLRTFTTDASKRYDGFRYENLNPGKYCLKISDPNGGYKTGPIGTDNKFNSSSINCFILDATTVNSAGILDVAAGFVPVGTEPVYTIRGYSWIDSNKNGKSEAGEPWLGDMTGTLTDIDGKEIGTFTTDTSKKYDGFRFDNMKQGGYCVKISDPKKTYDNGPMGDDNKINPSTQKYCFSVDATTVDSSKQFNIPAGFVPAVVGPKYTIRGYSWIDANKDGVSNTGEAWLGGMSGVLMDGDGNTLKTFTTDASKRYDGFRFENLNPGKYCLKISDPNGGYKTGPIGTDNKFNSSSIYCFTLDATTVNSKNELDISAGFVPVGTEPVYTIRGYSWIDSNKNGKSEAGEPWLGDMTGTLTDIDGKEIGTFTTDAAKKYDGFRFDNMKQGGYCVKISDPKKAYDMDQWVLITRSTHQLRSTVSPSMPPP
ncbi:hypothetical protein SAMD00019534_059250 [Acytostelium subglobosum LB1]|uniref:hypothetical protein n=1 Tax=Acytostelium subglobosum LB1 TaxID=1410327 RepID=UPI000644B75D|nr:hypothetical protein SAMD00019534_059250 [Acytostelium subglobosum LB1]GAM22750.1 hypothetical protein SAMD00019534_059250 [Acytostelium subglobosum LB1]|eukprot:XP_012753977.1 hypothetical protein SAMD00019534_059250 [Acytostelium subglobosum LB1]